MIVAVIDNGKLKDRIQINESTPKKLNPQIAQLFSIFNFPYLIFNSRSG